MSKLFLTVLLLLLPGMSSAGACDLSPVRFAEGEWSDAVASVLPKDARQLQEQFRVLGFEIGFSEPRYEEWAGGQVVDVLLSSKVDTQEMIDTWKKEAEERAHKRGCGTRTRWAKDFDWKIVDGRDVEGKFRVQYDKWSCGNIPFTGRQWKNKDAQFDATVWQIFKPRVKNGGDELKIEFSGDYKDNVPDELIDLIKLFANLVSVEPILSEVAKLDENIFARLKEYRDAIREIERFRVLGQGAAGILPVSGGGAKIFLDLVFSDARFAKEEGRLVLYLNLKSRKEKSILPSQACLVKDGLEKARLQGQRVGPNGRSREVLRGENAWSIARDAYGDGRYFQLVAAANQLADPNLLREGQSLRLEPLAKFLERGEVVVLSAGDSLWNLSREAGGGHGAFDEILGENGSLENPDLVYPVQVIRSASTGASTAGSSAGDVQRYESPSGQPAAPGAD